MEKQSPRICTGAAACTSTCAIAGATTCAIAGACATTCTSATTDKVKGAGVPVPVSSIIVPEYYIGAIPPEMKPIYSAFGIKYICVVDPAAHHFTKESGEVVGYIGGEYHRIYYIYEPHMTAVVARLGLCG